ncbi:MAG: MASE1 domain-containing protein [Candidatus Solibacter sp.]|nr:MASE1 domain-containing protein [Candidatus Solibacter sp.]
MDTVVHPPSAGAYRRDALWLALLAVAYFLAQELAFLLPGALKVVAAVWPAGGIGLAALLLSPRRRWPAILLTLFLAGMAANSAGRPLATGVGYMIANLAESLGCAWLISRWCGETVRFRRVKEVLALIVCVTAVNAGSALIGAGTATLAHASPFRDAWLTWWVADGLGILLVTPLIVTWSGVRQWFGGLRWGRTLESGLFLAAWCAAGWWTFQPAAHFHALSPQPYMLVGLLAWPALRLGQREVTLAMVVLAAMTLAGEAVYTGPLLWGGADPVERLLAVQVWIAFIAATGLLLTASYAEAQSAERSAREEHMRLQALGDNLPHGMVYQVVGDRDGSRRFQYVSSGSRELMGVSPEELLSDPSAFSSLIVEEDRPAFAAAQKASAGAMSVFDVSVRIRRRDGAVRWMQLSSTPRRLPDGRVLWDGILLDVTDRQREAAARLESEVRFRLVVKNAELPVLITSISDGTVLFANQCAARYFDVPQAEAMGLNAPDFWRDPAARARFSQTLLEAGRVVGERHQL